MTALEVKEDGTVWVIPDCPEIPKPLRDIK